MIFVVKKILSPNDLGLTGSHQSGFVVPKKLVRSHFFPELDCNTLNPRIELCFHCDDNSWKVPFIYYNNRVMGTGTRNEYRITCMTEIFKMYKCKVGDVIEITRDVEPSNYLFKIISSEEYCNQLREKPLVIQAGWEF